MLQIGCPHEEGRTQILRLSKCHRKGFALPQLYSNSGTWLALIGLCAIPGLSPRFKPSSSRVGTTRGSGLTLVGGLGGWGSRASWWNDTLEQVAWGRALPHSGLPLPTRLSQWIHPWKRNSHWIPPQTWRGVAVLCFPVVEVPRSHVVGTLFSALSCSFFPHFLITHLWFK